jgi:hypothetical protein
MYTYLIEFKSNKFTSIYFVKLCALYPSLCDLDEHGKQSKLAIHRIKHYFMTKFRMSYKILPLNGHFIPVCRWPTVCFYTPRAV